MYKHEVSFENGSIKRVQNVSPSLHAFITSVIVKFKYI